MKRILAVVLLSLLAIEPLLWNVSFAQTPKKIKVAVVDFANMSGKEEFASLSQIIPEVISTNWAESGHLEMVERSRLQDALKEMQLGLTGVVETESAAQLGRSVGANAILVGSFLLFGETVRITSRLIDVETGSVITGKSVDGATQNGKLGADVLRQMDDLSRLMEAKLTGATPEATAEGSKPKPAKSEQVEQALKPAKVQKAPGEGGSIFGKWWFWAGVGGLAAGGAALAASGGSGSKTTDTTTRVSVHITIPSH